MRLQTRMILMFSMLFTIGFLMLISSASKTVERANGKMVDTFSAQSFEFKAQEVGQWLGQRIAELRIIAQNQALWDERIDGAVCYIAKLNKNVGTQYGNEWGTFAVGYRDGIGWVSEEMYIDVSDREYFQQAMKGETEYVLSVPVISKTDQAEISLICYPLKNQKNEVYGFLNAAISLEKLEELVAELDFYEGNSWIMDPSGNIYTRSEVDKEVVEAVLPELNKGDPGQLKVEEGKTMVFYTAIPYTEQWYLCTAIKTSFLMEDTRQLTIKLTMVFLIVMILLFLCSILVSRSVTEPVHRLTKAMKEVEDGKWNVNLDIKGKDEIACLSRSFDQMVKKIHSLVLKTAQGEREKRTAELRILQAQINPHFLYNTLDTLQFKAYDTNDKEMVAMIRSLSTFFRISLSKGKELIPLEKELEHAKSYLTIQKIRFQDVLSYEFDIQAEGSFLVLKLILQPLAENAIQHGIRPKLEPGWIHIRVWQQGDNLIMEVEDNGVGITEERLRRLKQELKEGTARESYGLVNVNNRIRLLYGQDSGVAIESEEGKGTCVRVVLFRLQEQRGENSYGEFDNL